MQVKNENIYDLLIKAISNNRYLSEEEKVYFIKTAKSIIDNYDKIDLNAYLEKLETIYIKYQESNSKIITGEYHFIDNYIIFYNVKNINNIPPSIITHEIMHIQERDITANSAFSESINNIFNNEYFGFYSNLDSFYKNYEKYYDKKNYKFLNYDNSYSMTARYMYAISEIIGFEPLRDFHFRSNMAVIKKALYDIIPNYEIINNFINVIDLYHFAQNFALNSLEQKENLKSLDNKIIYYIKLFYRAKYNKPVENDIIMLLYLNKASNELIIKHLGLSNKDNLVYEYSGFNRPIFNNKGTSSCIITIIDYNNQIKIKEYKINENNRYIE